uniref:Uncharacterized protein n=1 Tax=Vespula pensylvanica TaxID=30213 RepID=A0A834JZK7_VESPE|nr:hypothetical protein H0235_016627 [Vespula pensylvanica]
MLWINPHGFRFLYAVLQGNSQASFSIVFFFFFFHVFLDFHYSTNHPITINHYINHHYHHSPPPPPPPPPPPVLLPPHL